MPKQDHTQTPKPTPEQAAKMRELPHRVQSAIAFLEGQSGRYPETEPKHLRVGVNSALVECSALAALLFRKGTITAEEYYDVLIEFWEDEVLSYQSRVKAIDPRLTI